MVPHTGCVENAGLNVRLTAHYRVVFKELIISQLVKKFITFFEVRQHVDV